MELPLTEKIRAASRAGSEEKSDGPVLDKFEEMSNTQLHTLVRSAEVRSGLELYRWYLMPKDMRRSSKK